MGKFDLGYAMRQLKQTNAKQPTKVYTPEERAALAASMNMQARPASAEEKAAEHMGMDIQDFRKHLAKHKKKQANKEE